MTRPGRRARRDLPGRRIAARRVETGGELKELYCGVIGRIVELAQGLAGCGLDHGFLHRG